jgi:hypothetical protein
MIRMFKVPGSKFKVEGRRNVELGTRNSERCYLR